jgi:hypothetical protein
MELIMQSVTTQPTMQGILGNPDMRGSVAGFLDGKSTANLFATCRYGQQVVEANKKVKGHFPPSMFTEAEQKFMQEKT